MDITDIPYLTPEVIRRFGISAGVYVFAFISFFFLSDVSTASSTGVIFSLLATAVIVNLFSPEFDRMDVIITSGSMVPVFLVLEYLAFFELYSMLGVVISMFKDVLLYTGFSLITATLVLYRMSPDKRMKLAREREEKRIKEEKMFYAPEEEKKPVGISKPEVSLLTGEETPKKKAPEKKPEEVDKLAALEQLDKEFEVPQKEVQKKKEPKKKLPPELEQAAFRINSLIKKGKTNSEIIDILKTAGFSKKEAQKIYEYASEL